MALEDIVNVSITAATASPSRPGFGLPLIMASKVPAAFTDRVRLYGSLAEMTSAGFATSDPAYRAATKIFSQNPRVNRVKVGRRASKPVQTLELTVLNATEGAVYKFTVNSTAITYTVLASATTTTVATAIAALINAVTDVDATSDAAVITVTKASAAPAGTLTNILELDPKLSLFDATADPGIADDLAACLDEDADWYGLVLDSNSEAEVKAAAAWVEANRKLFCANTSDSGVLDADEDTDVASDLKAASYARTALLYSGKELLSYSAAAWMGDRFPYDPGAATWKFKTLAAVTVDSLTAGQRAAALEKNCNVYTVIAGIPMTEEGVTSSGEFIDVTRDVDWLEAEIKVRVFQRLVNSQKVPYTDTGIDLLVAILKGTLQDAIRAGVLREDPEPVVVAPTVAEINGIDRADRKVPGITFTAELAGAIHALTIQGTLSV